MKVQKLVFIFLLFFPFLLLPEEIVVTKEKKQVLLKDDKTWSFIDKEYYDAHKTAEILKIVDGDTLTIKYMGMKEKIRLIGVDTPESRVNNKTFRDSERSKKDVKNIINLGKKATSFVLSQVSIGDEIRLEFDVEQRDKYNCDSE